MIIPDSSVVIAWCLREQDAPYADEALNCLCEESGIVPGIWPIEVGNALLSAERRKRTNPDAVQGLLLKLGELPIRIDSGLGYDSGRASASVERDGGLADLPVLWTLSRQYGLTVYDATYLELALRTGARLATLDDALLRAAKKAGAKVFEGAR